MSRRNSSSNGPFVLFGIGALIFGGCQAYISLKAVSDPLGITVVALLCIIGGLLLDAVLAGWCIFFDGNKARVLPWLLPLSFLAACPALTCRATRPAAFNVLAYVQDNDKEIEWWGSHGFEILVFIALCGVAYALMRKLDDPYGWR